MRVHKPGILVCPESIKIRLEAQANSCGHAKASRFLTVAGYLQGSGMVMVAHYLMSFLHCTWADYAVVDRTPPKPSETILAATGSVPEIDLPRSCP